MISAVVLAAGMSKRMGRSKLNLTWGDSTVIEQVVSTLKDAGINDIVVVTGANRQQVEQVLQGYDIRMVHNRDYARTEMLGSFQTGLRALRSDVMAVLVCLGDQPQIEMEIVRLLVDTYMATDAGIIIPSYLRRRGHPWILARQYWPEVLGLPEGATLRLFLEDHQDAIQYVLVDSRSVLQDLDTPADYSRYNPD